MSTASLTAGLSRLIATAPGLLRARPSLLSLTAGAAGLAAIANAVAVAAPAAEAPQQTRLGASIQQSARERDQALARQKRALELREQAARATEERLKADMLARQAETQRPVATDASSQMEESQPYDELARIYQTMKPAKAAIIFERLDLDVQTQVARRMRDRSTALILSNMSPNAAVQLSMALAGKRVVRPQSAPQRAEAPRAAMARPQREARLQPTDAEAKRPEARTRPAR